MKKKAKAKPKAKRLSQEEAAAKIKSPGPITVSSSEIKTPLKMRPRAEILVEDGKTYKELKVACESLGLNEGAVRLWIIKDSCKTYEETTGAKANQTRLIDFVRWCEENSGLL